MCAHRAAHRRDRQAPVLTDVSFEALPGQTTAIVGSTGSGKSTLINLIPRFYDATEGDVELDGVDVRTVRQEDLWRRIGVVPQRAFLFTGTVASNLRYGAPDATDEELWHALEVAQAQTFVEEMPGQLDAPITQGGTNVSGGQRQRLAIARAVVRRPEVYLFDDSFSALDFKTDSQLRAALREETRSATVIIVAQRVGTILHADRIVVDWDRRHDRRNRHPPRAARDVRDVPRDRLLAAQRGEGPTGRPGPDRRIRRRWRAGRSRPRCPAARRAARWPPPRAGR